MMKRPPSDDEPLIVITVTYTYDDKDGAVVTVVPDRVTASSNKSLRFRREGTMAGRLRLTFKDKECFHTSNPQFAVDGIVSEDDGDVHVKPTKSRRTTHYECEMLDANGAVIASSPAGGAVEVVT
jgi:hypothetical protein